MEGVHFTFASSDNTIAAENLLMQIKAAYKIHAVSAVARSINVIYSHSSTYTLVYTYTYTQAIMQKIVIIGTGFSGVWSVLSAKRLLNLRGKEDDVEIHVVSPEPTLVLRPRLYEANAAEMKQDLAPLFKAADIHFIKGTVQKIDTAAETVDVKMDSGTRTVTYNRLVLASGSAVVRPQVVQGLDMHGFDIDSLPAASKLEAHFTSLANLPPSPARDTIVVCGGGFTGIELATELPVRLGRNKRIILVEGASEVGPELGPGPRPVIQKALSDLGVETKLNSLITSISSDGVTLKSGEFIPTKTAIWTAGVRASPLTQQVPGPKDALARIHVDQMLRAVESNHVYATGDAAHVLADTQGQHLALMSCQHALILGRISGHNAAADLLGEELVQYSQAGYGCCLDLGGYGAVVCEGWEREVKVEGWLAKKVKRYINETLIYPPTDVAGALAAANPEMARSGLALRFVRWMLPLLSSVLKRIW